MKTSSQRNLGIFLASAVIQGTLGYYAEPTLQKINNDLQNSCNETAYEVERLFSEITMYSELPEYKENICQKIAQVEKHATVARKTCKETQRTYEIIASIRTILGWNLAKLPLFDEASISLENTASRKKALRRDFPWCFE